MKSRARLRSRSSMTELGQILHGTAKSNGETWVTLQEACFGTGTHRKGVGGSSVPAWQSRISKHGYLNIVAL